LRGVAILLVVVFHAGLPLRGGFVGVDVFFVISGFVITGMLLRELRATGALDLKSFYLRRIRRLLPALACLLTISSALAIFASPFGAQKTAAATGAAASLFLANAYLYRASPGYFDLGADLNPLLHTWSLAVEEQFYAVFPTLLLVSWIATRRKETSSARRRSAIVVMTVVTLASFFLSWAMTYGWPVLPRIKAPAQFAFYSSPTRAWEFGLGALLALVAEPLSRVGRGLLGGAGLLGAFLVAWSAVTFDGSTAFPGSAALLPVVGTALLITSGGGGAAGPVPWLSGGWLVWIGDRSYSWYLWHWPVVVYARALWPQSTLVVPVVASALSLLPAAASYRVIENPIRFARAVSATKTLRLALVCILTPLSACAILAIAHRAIARTATGATVATATRLHLDVEAGCDDSKPLNTRAQGACTWKVTSGRGRVLLIGDSNAGQFSEAVVQAANRLGYDATVATFHACPFVDLLLLRNGSPRQECRAFYQGALAALVDRPPSLIIVASASDGYIEEPAAVLRSPATGETATVPVAKARLWAEGERAALRNAARVAPVLVVHPLPRFPRWNLDAYAALTVMATPAACGITAARSAVDSFRRRALEAEQAAILATNGADSVDFVDDLCSGSTCSTGRDGRWIFHDGGHLTVDGALALADRFAAAIAANARH
jgi:peptidoglycan/LPS O-acetylase OafA/YrhL